MDVTGIVQLPKDQLNPQLNPPSAKRTPTAARRWSLRLLLMLFGIGMAVLIFEEILHLFPGLIPDGRAHGVDMGMVQFTVGMGDIFIARPGVVAPPDNPYQVLSQHHLVYDTDGFRIPEKPADHYDVIALGDSYTEGPNVARPWPDIIAENSKLAVRNLGFRGYGPIEELNVLKQYGVKSGAKLVIVGFFEGNDLDDEVSARTRPAFVIPNIARKAFAPFDPNAGIWKTDNKGPFQFPINVEINGQRTPLAFLDTYLIVLTGTPDVYAQSDNVHATEQTFQEMQQAIHDNMGKDTCLTVAYLPDAPHIYMPYVVPEDRARLLSTIQEQAIVKPDNILGTKPLQASFDELLTRLDNQHNAVKTILDRQHIPMIDLVPTFKAAAAQGNILYYTYDTHWNQSGQELAGKTIADYLAQHPNPCAGQANP